MKTLRQEMRDCYEPLRGARIDANREFMARHDRIWAAMDDFARQHPDTPAVLLKARLHTEIAGQFEPVIFPHSPFFFEMGVRFAENWGCASPANAGAWLWVRRNPLCYETPQWRSAVACSNYNPDSLIKLWAVNGVFDFDHHCLGYTKLLQVGVNGLMDEVRRRRARGGSPVQLAFLDAALRSGSAVLRVASRFAEKAEQMLATNPALDAPARRFLQMMAETARRIPAEPPQTFYEGLAFILFMREVTGSLEGIGISVLGHIDRLLIDLYRRDAREGRLTEAEARDLLARWMLHTDVKFHIEDNAWPETSTCIELGGCDADGRPVANELTRLIVETHRDHGLLNPKLNCRYSAGSSPDYLQLLCRTIARGHNNFAFLNDDTLIPALIRTGKTEREARLYVNGGCQETMAEGVEHSAGAYYYFNLARLLDLCLQSIPMEKVRSPDHMADRAVPPLIDQAVDFEEWYRRFLEAIRQVVTQGAEWLREPGIRWPEVHPCPFYSTSLEGCIESATDYTAGGAKYNPAGVALVGFGTVVDSMHAIRRAVFEDRWCTLAALREALAHDWEGCSELRARLVALPKFGHGNREVDELAHRLARDFASLTTGLRNERGGPFQASMFVYYAFVNLGHSVRATPDGRRNGEMLSQGTSPGRVRPAEDLTSVFHGLARVDYRDYPGNAVLDLQLPLGGNGNGASHNLEAMLRTFAQMGGPTLQFNCVSVEKLKEAQRCPEKHSDLIVRISGLSARFVALTKDVQDEIITRTQYQT